MAKYTALRERIRVAKETGDAAEIWRINREISDAFKAGGLVKAAKRMGVNAMTLSRALRDLGLSHETSTSRGKPDPLVSETRVAIDTGNAPEVERIRANVTAAMESAESFAAAASVLGVSAWVLNKVITMLSREGEDIRSEAKYSSLGERVLVAQRAENAEALEQIRTEIAAALERSGGDMEQAAVEFGVSAITLRKLVDGLGVSTATTRRRRRASTPLIMSRLHLATRRKDAKGIEKIRREVISALRSAGGSMKIAREKLGLSDWTMRHLVDELGMRGEIEERFPGIGKPRHVTARIDGKTETHTVAEWARITGIKRTTILQRLKAGFTPEHALSGKDLRTR